MRYSRLICRRRAVPAFTLTEMLLVMAVLGTLLALVMPLFGHAMEISRSAKCKSNLHSLAALLHTEDGQTLGLLGGSVHTIPTANRWLDFVMDRRVSKLVLCPSGTIEGVRLADLRRVWVRQDGGGSSVTPGVYYSNLEALLSGTPIPDTQVGALYKGNQYGANNGWDWVEALNGGPPEANEAFVTIATCAAFKITLKETTIILTPLGHAPHWNSGSMHWLIKGSTPDEGSWESDVLVRLTGQGYTEVNPPVTVYGGNCHYGMSNIVPVRNYLPSQLWLTEYCDEVVSLTTSYRDEPFDDDLENGEVMARHFGSANCVRVDGSVFSMTKGQLEAEFDKLDDMGNIFQK